MPTASDRSFRARLTAHASSSGGIYGLVLVAGMIVVSRDLDTTSSAPLTVALTLLVFFAAHLYAATVAHLSGSRSTLREALGHSFQESVGLLVVGAVPIAVLWLGVIGPLRQSDAVWLALTVDMILLGVLGWFITAPRSPRFLVRLGGTLLTAILGAAMIVLKALIHH